MKYDSAIGMCNDGKGDLRCKWCKTMRVPDFSVFPSHNKVVVVCDDPNMHSADCCKLCSVGMIKITKDTAWNQPDDYWGDGR